VDAVTADDGVDFGAERFALSVMSFAFVEVIVRLWAEEHLCIEFAFSIHEALPRHVTLVLFECEDERCCHEAGEKDCEQGVKVHELLL